MENKVFSIQLKGGLDGTSADDLYRYFESQLEKGYKSFLLNFYSVDYITSSGISILVKIHKQIRKLGYVYAVYGIREEVESVLKMIGLFETLPIFFHLSEAESFLQKTKPSFTESQLPSSEPASLEKQKETKQIRFFYSGNSKPILDKEPVSTLESLDEKENLKPAESPNFENKIKEKSEIDNKSLISPMESLLEEKISELRLEIKDSLQTELEKRLSFYKTSFKEDPSPVSMPSYIQSKSKQKEIGEKIIHCESCNARLKISKIGIHQCPKCNIQFEMGHSGVLRYLEKLKS